MQNITSVTELRYAIKLLEDEQIEKSRLLKENFHDMIKPLQSIENTIDEVTSSPFLVKNIVGSVLALASGFITRKLVVGSSRNKLLNILGAALQFGITNLVSQNPDSLKKFGQLAMQFLFRKKN